MRKAPAGPYGEERDLHTIADTTRERIRRAGRKIQMENPGKDLDVGFRAYKVVYDNPALQALYASGRNRRPLIPDVPVPQTLLEWIMDSHKGFNTYGGDITLLTNLLLVLGDELTVPLEQYHAEGHTFYMVDGGKRIVCLQAKVSMDAIAGFAAAEPEDIVVYESALGGDEMVATAAATIHFASPGTQLRLL